MQNTNNVQNKNFYRNRQVQFKDFTEPVVHKNVESVVYKNSYVEGRFMLGFLPEGEFIYEFTENPDVYFKNLSVREIYHEPYRTFIRLRQEADVEVRWLEDSDKICVCGVGAVLK